MKLKYNISTRKIHVLPYLSPVPFRERIILSAYAEDDGEPMHHLLLLVVLFGWILFLLLTWQIALPVYAIAVIISLAIYWKIIEAQRKAPAIGKRAMIGNKAVVVRVDGDDVEVEYEGEVWRAVSPEPLQQGQKVMIKGIEGLTLKVVPSKS